MQLYLPLSFLVITKVCFPAKTNHLFIMRLFPAHYAEFKFVTEEQRLSYGEESSLVSQYEEEKEGR